MKRTAKPTAKSPDAPEIDPSFAPLVDAFARDRGVSVGKIFVSAGLKVNGKFFVFVRKGQLVAKLPKERVAELIASGKGEVFDRGQGKPMKEWISIPPGGPSWLDVAKEARQFVGKSE